MVVLFETERLIARQWHPEADAEQAFEIYGDPLVNRYLGKPAEPTVEATRSRLQGYATLLKGYTPLNGGIDSMALVEKSTGSVVGNLFLTLMPDENGQPTGDWQVGWHLARSRWGKGYATEAAKAVLARGFDVLGLGIIHAVTECANDPSKRVALRLGMIPVGRTDKYYGEELDLFRLEAGEYRRRISR